MPGVWDGPPGGCYTASSETNSALSYLFLIAYLGDAQRYFWRVKIYEFQR